MTSSRRRPATDDRQLAFEGLYELPLLPTYGPGSLSMGQELCGVLTSAMKRAEGSRAEIAARMSDLTHANITEAMLNAYTAKSHDRHRFPLEFAAAFEVACGTYAIQQLIAEKRGSVVLVGREALDAELGKLRRQQEELRQRERQLTSIMKVVR